MVCSRPVEGSAAKIEGEDRANNTEDGWNQEIVTAPGELDDKDNGCKWHLHGGCQESGTSNDRERSQVPTMS